MLPGPDVNDDAPARAHISGATSGPTLIPARTCRIGTDKEAVVDTDLRVHGISGLGVVGLRDALPALRDTNATVYAIAERAADLI